MINGSPRDNGNTFTALSEVAKTLNNEGIDTEKDILKEIVNKSISQTLSRSILTSITTLVMVVCLYIMGVSSIKEFALPLIVGIIAGGYSSVFIAGIVWRFLRIKFVPKYEDEDD